MVESASIKNIIDDPSRKLLGESNRVWTIDLAEASVQRVSSDVLTTASLVGDDVLRKQVSLFVCAFAALEKAAILSTWFADKTATVAESALTEDSARCWSGVRDVVKAFFDFVTGRCKAHDLADVSLAVQAQAASCARHHASFDDFPWGKLDLRVRTECKVVMNEVAERWRKMLVDLCDRILAGCIDWRSRGEDILDVAQKDLCLQILKNLGYKTLTGLATMVLNMARVAKRYDIFDVAFVESCVQHARRGLEMVSLMFTLIQIKVAWPKLNGARNQVTSSHWRLVFRLYH